MMRRAVIALSVAAVASSAPAALAADPGTWVLTSHQSESPNYRQGIASDGAGNVFFDGPFVGVYKMRGGKEIAANSTAIPQDVQDREQYNHMGDLAFDASQGGRLLLPLESYQPGQADSNPSKTGSFAVVDPATLRWSYYVKLDPTEIPKAMMVATDTANGLAWTVTGKDVIAYKLSNITAANAAPTAAPIHSVRRLANVVPDGLGGIVVLAGRIFFSASAGGVERVTSVDENTGASRTEIEMPGSLEAEGLDTGPYLGGLLHWELVSGLGPTQVYNFVPKGSRLSLRLNHARVTAKKRTTLTATIRVVAGGKSIPLPGAQLRIAGHSAKANATGKAKLSVKLTRGSYRAEAFFKGLRTATAKLRAT